MDFKPNSLAIIAAMGWTFIYSLNAHAGFLNKLNQAAEQLNKKAEQMQKNQDRQKTKPAEDPDRPLRLENYDNPPGL